MKIYDITDKSFKQYGKIIKGYDLDGLIEEIKKLPVSGEVVYEPSDERLEKYSDMFSERFYGNMEVQIGYCNGKNYKLNCVEYHRSSEINIMTGDTILLLGRVQDIEDDFTYDTSLIEGFFIPKNTAVEIYATTLHYAPCSVGDEYFKVGIVLPRGTNYPLEKSFSQGEEKLLTAKNKFLIAHSDSGADGFIGLKGENIDVRALS